MKNLEFHFKVISKMNFAYHRFILENDLEDKYLDFLIKEVKNNQTVKNDR